MRLLRQSGSGSSAQLLYDFGATNEAAISIDNPFAISLNQALAERRVMTAASLGCGVSRYLSAFVALHWESKATPCNHAAMIFPEKLTSQEPKERALCRAFPFSCSSRGSGCLPMVQAMRQLWPLLVIAF